ncbi:MAG: cyclic nucleotide-binding domain-containing protein [Leptospiraceae bacterium]|nr:cyclic nucleotide-binding domain-containing protein [Leptospiraceae bacterium]
MVTFFEIIFSLFPFLFSYFFYKRSKSGNKLTAYIDSIFYGILIAAIIILLMSVFDRFFAIFSTLSPILIGFFHAAFIEKIGAFVYLYFITKNQKSSLRIVNIINFGIFYAAGFAALENLVYALTVDSTTIFIRLFSSVILHLTTCSIMANFVALANLFTTKVNKIFYLSLGFFIPFLCHGIYDSFLLLGGNYTYIIGPELAILIFITEYIIARSSIFPIKSQLLSVNLTLEDWIVIHRQPEYDRWILLSMDKKNQERVPFFKFSRSYYRWTLIFLLAFTAVLFIPLQSYIVKTFFLQLTTQESITLFVLYPGVVAFYLLTLGAINPDYFRYSRISIPILSEVNLAGKPGMYNELSSDINGYNCFIKSLDSLGIGNVISLSFKFSKYYSPKINGIVIWDNQSDVSYPFGSILRFEKLSFRFYRFVFWYNFFKFWKGFLFNLRIPGFEQIRKFFVKTLTVMEDFSFYPEGTILFREGEIGDKFYLLKRGNVRIYKTMNSGEEVELSIVKPGEIFGEMAILGNQERAATAICTIDSMLAVADGDNLDALIRGNPEFSHKLIQTLAIRVKKSERILTGEINKLEKSIKINQTNSDHDLDYGTILKALMDTIHQPIMVVTEKHKILFANNEIEKYTEIPLQKLIGMNLQDTLFFDDATIGKLFNSVINSDSEYIHTLKKIGKVSIKNIYIYEPKLYLITLKLKK